MFADFWLPDILPSMKMPTWITWHFGPNPPYLSRYGSTSQGRGQHSLTIVFACLRSHQHIVKSWWSFCWVCLWSTLSYNWIKMLLQQITKGDTTGTPWKCQTVVQGVFKVSLAMACKSHSGNLNHWQNSFFSVRNQNISEWWGCRDFWLIMSVRSSNGFLFFCD